MSKNTSNTYEKFIEKIIAETIAGHIAWEIDTRRYPFFSGNFYLIKQFICSLNDFDLLLANLKEQVDFDDYDRPYEEIRIVVIVLKDGIPAQTIDKRSVNETFLWKLDACATQSATQVQEFINSYIR